MDHPTSDFFRYSSGRWLWNEEQQLQCRYKAFNIYELQRVAVKSVGAKQCISIVKLGEGNYNRAFRLTMDNALVVIARIPFPNAGPSWYTTASEVATMDLARTALNLPVPKVLAWSARESNPTGSEYIIMEEAEGLNLGESWDYMNLGEKLKIVHDIVNIEKKLLSLRFSCYGSIYYASDWFKGCQKLEVVGDVPKGTRSDVETRFIIGPAATRDFWNKERSTMDISRGPWALLSDFVKAVAHRETAWLERYAVPQSSGEPFYTSAAQNDPGSHIALLQKLLQVAEYLFPKDPDLQQPTIWHSDIHPSNLFVSGGQITSLIDWQDVWAGPLCFQARIPRIFNHVGEVVLERPGDFETLEQEEQDYIDKQLASTTVQNTYASQTSIENPTLDKLYDLKYLKTRMEPVMFAGESWDDNIVRFRECLIKLERQWHKFCPEVPCPFKFTPEELVLHAHDSEGWNELMDFWGAMEGAGLATSDGWTSNEAFEQALECFREVRREILLTKPSAERYLIEAHTRWLEVFNNPQTTEKSS